MREIKFRGKDCWGNWRYGDLMKNSIPTASPVIVEDFYYDDPDDSMFEVAPNTVGQFTGLTDEDGREVYEGDIVQNKTTDEIGVVFYHNAEFLVKGANDRFTLFRFVYSDYGCTVIGNIHDSPELLEADNARD